MNYLLTIHLVLFPNPLSLYRVAMQTSNSTIHRIFFCRSNNKHHHGHILRLQTSAAPAAHHRNHTHPPPNPLILLLLHFGRHFPISLSSYWQINKYFSSQFLCVCIIHLLCTFLPSSSVRVYIYTPK